MKKEKQKNHSEELLDTANKLIRRIQQADEIEASEVEDSFRIVMQWVQESKPAPTRRHIHWWSAVAAAVIAIAVCGYLYERSEELPTTTFNITLLDHHTPSTTDSEVTLITNQSTMNLKDSTSLEYDKTGASNAQQYLLNESNQVAQSENKTHQMVVPKGKRANVTLSDGTKIYINSGSRVIYPELFDKEKREILIEGEVYLEVAANKGRPFIVKTRSFEIEVLGTAFNVCAYRDERAASVVLVNGSVEVTTENKNRTGLKPNQLMSIEENKTSICQVDVSEYISWKENQLLIEQKSLSTIFTKLERYYGYKISCSPKVASMALSGKLDLHSSVSHVMDNLCLLLSLEYTINSEKEIIVSQK